MTTLAALSLHFPFVWYGFLLLFGLALGSFYNVVIYRLPRGMSLAMPPSHCPSCNRRLRWFENIPILSYLFLRGRCRTWCAMPCATATKACCCACVWRTMALAC